MKFLWNMNKAYIYSEMGSNEQRRLFFNILLHFVSILKYKEIGIYDKLETPSHTSRESFALLSTVIQIQELFILAHEMAHIVIEKNSFSKSETKFYSSYLLTRNDEFLKSEYTDVELLADEIAFNTVLNIMGSNEKDLVELVSTSIFLMIRYFLWFRVSLNIQENDLEFISWLSRNNFFRKKINEVYYWNEPIFIVDVLDNLEMTLESAALDVGEILRKMIQNT